MKNIYTLLIANKQKAIVGGAVALAVAYFAKHGIDIETLTVKDALQLISSAVVGWVTVYFTRNK